MIVDLTTTEPLLAALRLIRDMGVLLGTLVICVLAWRKHSLSLPAAILSFLLALALFLSGGLLFIILLLLFFATSTFFTRFHQAEKKAIERNLHARSGPRAVAQVAANGGPALIMALLYAATHNPLFVTAFAGALAACNADTWASEIGVLSKAQPISLLTRRPVQRGLSGGVTALGTLASLGGAAVIALVYLGWQRFFAASYTPAALQPLLRQSLLVLLAGGAGSLFDSLLGETLQAQYSRPKTGSLTEKSQENNQANHLRRGFAWMTNDLVNFISALLAAGVVLVSARLMRAI
jgi:uncharacterized protein (TIGR00297 family)